MQDVYKRRALQYLGLALVLSTASIATGVAASTVDHRVIDTSQVVFHGGFEDAELEARIAVAFPYLVEEELADGRTVGEVVMSVARDSTMNPLLLLAALEARNGDLSRISKVDELARLDLGTGGNGLEQRLENLAWQAAGAYYESRDEDLEMAGTAALFALLADGPRSARLAAQIERFVDAYTRLWDDPLARDDSFYFHERTRLAHEGKIPATKANPTWFQLPWTTGETWTFNSGPHNFGTSGTPRPWSSLDYGPPGAPKCATQETTTSSWARPVASGWIKAKDDRSVTVRHWSLPYDDPLWETRYYHLWSITSLAVNASVSSTTNLGKVGCKGITNTNATAHLHMSLLYNGSYVEIHGTKLSGWTVNEGSSAYQGSMVKSGVTKTPISSITKWPFWRGCKTV